MTPTTETAMRYVMLTYNGEETLRWWEAASQAEKQAEVERTVAWFQEHGAKGRIVGGEELGPRRTRRRSGREA